MEPRNPYESPRADLGTGVASVATNDGQRVTRKMIEELAGTKPWARLCAIMGFIGTGFMLLAGLAMVLIGSVIPGSTGMPGGALFGLVYILLAALYVIPSVFLFRYASSIQRLLKAGQESDMERALGDQRSFWRSIGVMILVMLVIYAIALVTLAVVGIASAT